MDGVHRIAKEHGLIVIEDAAQAIGAEYNGERAGSLGDFGCFSFFPSKNLGGFGDGGIVTTQSRDFYERLVKLRVHGSHPKYYHQYIGGNFRLDAIQAAIVSIKLKYLDNWTRARQENARKYRTLIDAAGLAQFIDCPVEKESRHIYNQFVIHLAEKRDALKAFLTEKKIGCEIYYPVPLHLQACYSFLGHQPGDFPVSEHAADHTLALPIYPELPEEQLHYVVECMHQFFA
jgi:dTDP-4-amino-4,6-dideoxygalactose transaminase